MLSMVMFAWIGYTLNAPIYYWVVWGSLTSGLIIQFIFRIAKHLYSRED